MTYDVDQLGLVSPAINNRNGIDVVIVSRRLYGPVVKRSRHLPFTEESAVQLCPGSPMND